MTSETVLALTIALTISAILLVIVARMTTVKKSSNAYTASVYRGKNKKKSNTKSNLLTVYKYLVKIPIYNKHVHSIERQYTILYPDDEVEVRKKTASLAIITAIVSFIALAVVIILGMSPYMIMITVLLIYVLNSYVIRSTIDREDLALLEQFNSFMSDVRHSYFDCQMVDESVEAAIEVSKKKVRPHAEKILKILRAEDIVEETQKYNNVVPNRFIQSFVALCVITLQYGDKKVRDESNFLLNLKNLKQEIYIEILKRRKLAAEFRFLVAITIIPIFTLEIIKNWGISNIPELDNFYNGTKGIIAMLIILLSTLLTYSIILRMKEMDVEKEEDHFILRWIDKRWPFKAILDNYMQSNYAKMQSLEKDLKRIGQSITARLFMLKRILTGGVVFIVVMICLLSIHSSNKDRLLNNVNNIDSITSGATEDDIAVMRESIIYYTTYFRYNTVVSDADGETILAEADSFFSNGHPMPLATMTGKAFKPSSDSNARTDGILNTDTISMLISADKNLKSTLLCDAAAGEVIKRIISFNNEYLRWYEVLGAVLAAIIGYYYPLLLKMAQTVSLQRAMEDEVIQFQTIITMLVYIDRMTIDTIIEWMEEFGVIFKDSLTECLNRLNAGDNDALDGLVEAEPFEMFDRVIENLKMSDRIGVAKAFNEVEVERANYQDKRKQENEIEIKDKGAMAQFISMLPLAMVIGIYLIYPVIVEALGQLSTSMSSL